MSADENDTFICPNCGTELSVKTKACPECGSDEKTGWSDQTIYDGTGIVDPDEDDFNYEDWKRRELGGSMRKGGREWLWWVVALVVLLMVVWLLLIR